MSYVSDSPKTPPNSAIPPKRRSDRIATGKRERELIDNPVPQDQAVKKAASKTFSSTAADSERESKPATKKKQIKRIEPVQSKKELNAGNVRSSKKRGKTATDYIQEFVYATKHPTNKEVTAFIDNLREDPPTDQVVAILSRYDGLEHLPEFEKKQMPYYERLQLALTIEVKIPTIEHIAETHFLPGTKESYGRDITAPRDMFVNSKRRIHIMAEPTKSQLSAKGSWKEVFSGVKVYEDDTKIKPIAIARISVSSSEDEELVNKEMDFCKRLQEAKVPGIASARFYTDITGMKKAVEDYVHHFDQDVEYTSHKVAGFNRYAQSLETAKNLTIEQKIHIAKSFTKTVSGIHEHNIIHGDLKRENILLEAATKNPSVTDFGLSFDFKNVLGKTELHPLSYKKGRYGTPVYSAPELLKAKNFSGDLVKTESWAVGIILLELLTEKDIPFKEVLPSPEEFQKLKYKEKEKLLTQLKAKIPEYIQKFEPRIAALTKKGNKCTPAETLELTAYKLLRLDPSERITPAQAHKLLSAL